MRNILPILVLLCLQTLVQAQTPETLVGWDGPTFTYQSTNNTTFWRYPYANTGIVGNINVSTMNTFGGVAPSTASDAYGNGNQIIFNENPGTGWINGMGVKGWVFKFASIGYEGLKFSGKMAGSTSLSSFRGPRDFKLQYSLDSLTWTDVNGGSLAAGVAGAASYNLTSLSNVPLPAVCDNKPLVYLRMLMTSNASPDNATATASGQSFVDDFMVTGQTTPVAPSNLLLSPSVVQVAIGAQTTAGLTIGALTSVDFNLGNTFTYSFETGFGDTHNGLFTLSGTNLVASVPLSRGIYSIRLRTTDNTGLYLEKILKVYIVEAQPGIFTNPITGTAPANSNPYTAGQTVAANLTVSGIKRGSGLNVSTSNDRYACTNWTAAQDANKYFEFILTPASTYGITFEYLDITLQRTSTSAKNFTLRSSVDNFTSDIFSLTPVPTTATTHRIPLLHPSLQYVTTPITFRLYGWDATSTTSTASVNDFSFKGQIGNGGCTPTSNSSTVTTCGSYVWGYNNQTYTTSGTYTAVGWNTSGCTHTETLNLTISPQTTLSSTITACDSFIYALNGLTYMTSGVFVDTIGCDVYTLDLTIVPSTTVTQNEQTCNAYTWNVTGLTYTTSGIYTQTAGCQHDELNLQIDGCSDIRFIIEGYHVGGGLMQPVLSNQGVAGFGLTDADSVTIEFRNAVAPYTVDYTFTGVLATDGNIHAVLPETAIGQSYYVALQHRNSIETWSAVPVLIGSNTVYDFSSAASQAYGGNQVEVEPGVFAIYSGDIVKDGAVDVADYLVLDQDIIAGAFGYQHSDINGDAQVDVFDYLLLDINLVNGVSYNIP